MPQKPLPPMYSNISFKEMTAVEARQAVVEIKKSLEEKFDTFFAEGKRICNEKISEAINNGYDECHIRIEHSAKFNTITERFGINKRVLNNLKDYYKKLGYKTELCPGSHDSLNLKISWRE